MPAKRVTGDERMSSRAAARRDAPQQGGRIPYVENETGVVVRQVGRGRASLVTDLEHEVGDEHHDGRSKVTHGSRRNAPRLSLSAVVMRRVPLSFHVARALSGPVDRGHLARHVDERVVDGRLLPVR
jgi:hypothetical protein